MVKALLWSLAVLGTLSSLAFLSSWSDFRTGKTSMGATCILDGERALGLMPNFASFDEMQQKVDLQSGIGDLEAKQSTLISMPAFCQNIVMDVGIYEVCIYVDAHC